MNENPRIAVNLTPEDHELVHKLKAAIAEKLGTVVATTQVIRMALRVLAKQERVK